MAPSVPTGPWPVTSPNDRRAPAGASPVTVVHVAIVVALVLATGGAASGLAAATDGSDAAPWAAAAAALVGAALTFAVALALWSARRREQRARDGLLSTEALVASMQDGLAVIGTDGRLRQVNDRYCALVGAGREDLLGTSIPFPHWPEERRGEMEAVFRAAQEGVTGEIDLEVVRPSGQRIPVIAAVSALRGAGGVTGVVETLKDASERRAAEHARRAAAVEQQVAREQEALRQVATAVASEQEPRRIFAQVAEQARRVLGADSAAVVRFEGPRGTVVGAAGGAARTGPPLGARLPLEGGGIAARIRRDAATTPGGPTAAYSAVSGAVGAAVHARGGLWGAVCVFGGEDDPAEAGTKLARFAELVGLAIASADARQQLNRLASTDHLTGLPNKRTFQERLAAEVERARRHDRDLGLVLFDVDDFKRINDRFGHGVGDRILRELAERLGRVVRTGEMLARVGGEEFGWILPEASGIGAYSAAERARAVVAEQEFGEVGKVTVSAGVCDLAQAPGGGGELFRLADVALYWAKSNGRNVTFRYSPEAIQVLSAEQQAGRLEQAQAVSAIRVLARAVDAKHPDTRRHSERVAEIALRIARELGWAPDRVATLRDAAMVHDVGKISVPDAILLKPGRLDREEYEQVKRHASVGAEIVAGILNSEQIDWVRHHHERIDGRGYPDGLDGTQLSEGACILAVADAWDAMTRARTYSSAMSGTEALAECRRVAGRQLHADVVGALERLWRRGELEDDDPMLELEPGAVTEA